MKDNIEFVGVIVKVNGKKLTIKRENCHFTGWEYTDDDAMESDSGVDLELRDGRKIYRLSL